MKVGQTLLASSALALVLAPAALAHLEISPAEVAADSDARLALEVPTERNVPTVKLEVKLPPGLDEVSVQAKPGWKTSNRGGVVTWAGGKIAPGQFDEFALRAHVPKTPGKELVFPAVQTYANGEVVRWIGAPGSDTPAPRVTLEAAAGGTTTKTPKGGSGEDHDGLARGLGIAGLAAGLLALGVALLRKRRA